MATRHQVRQAIVSLLYSNEINPVTAEFEEEFLEEKKIRNERKNEALQTFKEVLANKEKLDDYDIEETHNFLYWLLDVVHLLKETYVFSFSNMEEVFEALTEELAVLKEFKKKNDFIAYDNALEYRVTDILENFKSNIDYYCKNIIEEEKIKKITI